VRRRVRRSRPRITIVVLALIIGMAWASGARSCGRDDDDHADAAAVIDRELGPPLGETKEGIAAIVLMDVSGSMANEVRDGNAEVRKIDIARRAGLALIEQFGTYASTHPDEPVLVGLFEFSTKRDHPAARVVIPLSAADPERARPALAQMRASGGTPIGAALLAAKRTLDGSGLSRRHLLVVTDGENTDGFDPVAVMAALSRRPERERPSVYFVAFDVKASRFDAVRERGGLVLGAADAQELESTLGTLLTGKILVEGP
jgi:Mg-chelatase subunit ChlD